MTKEYIERGEALRKLTELYDKLDPRWQRGRDCRLGVTTSTKVIENQPIADVQEVRYGKPVQMLNDVISEKIITVCSCCNGKISKKDTWCKHCGAKMKKEEL